MKKHIPNLVTLLNLLSGTIALLLVVLHEPATALWFVVASLVFDFSDGLLARMLKARSEVGKQLDSLADVVSFGLVPSMMIFMVLKAVMDAPVKVATVGGLLGGHTVVEQLMLLSVLVVPALAALRLAKFNLQPASDFFRGLPTPAFAMFWTGIYYDIFVSQSIFHAEVGSWFFVVVMVFTALLMIIPLPMLSLKFGNFRLFPNFSRYLLLVLSALILVFTGVAGLPLVILTYILLSLVRILLT